MKGDQQKTVIYEKNHNSLNHFIFLIFFIDLLCIIILMSFSNYGHLFFPGPYYFQMPFFQYPPPEHSWTSTQPGIKLPQSSSIAQESNPQHTSKDLDYKILEQNLQKLHSESQNHRKCHWTALQDKLLEKLVQVQKLEWKEIPKHFQNRTQNMCYSRYRRISMCIKDRLWQKDQEELVQALVQKFGQKWKLISQKMPKFTPKQIRERYLNYLRPTISKQDFSLDEDIKICKYVLEQGKHWRKMEQILPGRSEGSIKGRYYGKLQKVIEESMKSSVN